VKAKFRIEGLSDIASTLRALPNATSKATLTRFAKKRLEPMRAAASQNAPEDTGELQEQIIVSTRQGKASERKKRLAKVGGVEVAMGPTTDVAEKAIPQEFGFRDVPPKGFMRRAWDQHHGALIDNLAADLGKEVDSTVKRRAKRLARQQKG
jgi:HK97 gp10 family phage protein